MQFIIIGLGYFGSALATKLTELGNEVIGADLNMDNIERIKDKITHAVCMDCTDAKALKSLPLNEADAVINAIGEGFGASVLITAQLKKYGVKKLIARSISTLHHGVLESLGVDEIINPENDFGIRFAHKLAKSGVLHSIECEDEFVVQEVKTPDSWLGRKISDLAWSDVKVITAKRSLEKTGLLGNKVFTTKLEGFLKDDYVLKGGDTLIVFGKSKDIIRLIKLEK